MLAIAVEYLSPAYHGTGDWPPSPWRLLSALVAAAGRSRIDNDPLHFLERQPDPVITAPRVCRSTWVRFVPGNEGRDGAIWGHSRHKDEVEQAHLAAGRHAVTYYWPVDPSPEVFAALAAITSRMTVLGRGIDLVVARASLISIEPPLPGDYERWVARPNPRSTVFVPRAGAVEAMERAHTARLPDRQPTWPASCRERVRYVRDSDLEPSIAAYRLVYRDRPWPTHRAVALAGMMRHAVSTVARIAGCTEEWIRDVALGHGTDHTHRIDFLPLPSIQAGDSVDGKVGDVRRIVITRPPGMGSVCDRLDGHELVSDRGDTVARLEMMDGRDGVLDRYLEPAQDWVSVTPVVLSGHDRDRYDRAEALLARDLERVGLRNDVEGAELRGVGWLSGTDLATRYLVPQYHRTRSRYHLRLRLRRPLGGPHVVGAGRHMGIGLLVRAGW